jgi:hypothetical protein
VSTWHRRKLQVRKDLIASVEDSTLFDTPQYEQLFYQGSLILTNERPHAIQKGKSQGASGIENDGRSQPELIPGPLAGARQEEYTVVVG